MVFSGIIIILWTMIAHLYQHRAISTLAANYYCNRSALLNLQMLQASRGWDRPDGLGMLGETRYAQE